MRRKPSHVARAIVALVAILILVLAGCGEVFARGSSGGRSSGGSSRSFSGSSWSSRSSSSAPSRSSSAPSWGGKSDSAGLATSGARGAKPAQPTTTKTEAGSASKGAAPSASMSKADKALYEQAKSKGTAFKTRDEAASAFKQQNESKYQSRFSSEPSRRPNYIPDYYTSPGGARYQVTYRTDLGGYGYYDSTLGRWMLYSVFADAAMTSMLMHSHGYYYGPPPTVYYRSGWGFFSSLGALILIVLVIVAVVRISQIRRRY